MNSVECTYLNHSDANMTIRQLNRLVVNNFRIIVIGDTIVDILNRVSSVSKSPEGNHNNYELYGDPHATVGGAYNIARYARTFCNNVMYMSAFGDESALYGGKGIDALLGRSFCTDKNRDIKLYELCTLNDTPLTSKTRYIHNGKILHRIDRNNYCGRIITQKKAILNAIHRFKPDVIIVQNYGKGLLYNHESGNNLLEALNEINAENTKGTKFITTIYGAHISESSIPTGFNYVRCNRAEANKLKLHTIRKACKDGYVITSPTEILFYDKINKKKSVDTSMVYLNTDNANVCGAGDMVTALLGMFDDRLGISACGKNDSPNTGEIISTLATIKCNDSCATYGQPLIDYYANLLCYMKGHVITDAKMQLLENIMKIRYYIVPYLINGKFEYIHAGHMKLFDEFPDEFPGECSVNIVAINSDESFEKTSGRKPRVSFEDRALAVSKCPNVGFVIGFNSEGDLGHICACLRPIMIKGEEYKDKRITGAEHCKNIKFVPMYKNIHVSNT